MPRKSIVASVADAHAAPGGVAAVDRALSILTCFHPSEATLSLGRLAEVTRLHKSTLLRLLASLLHAGFIHRGDDGRYSIGPVAAQLQGAHHASFSLQAVVMPVLRLLAIKTEESAAFHVRRGEVRICLYRVDSSQAIRDHVRPGDVLPLERGAGGRVLLAYTQHSRRSPEFKAMCGELQAHGVIGVREDRTQGVAGVSAPVFDATGSIAGALIVTMPNYRYKEKHLQTVRTAAIDLCHALGGEFTHEQLAKASGA
ncbi:MAG: helix-turn-helix domain-containing protein [Rhizobacter sp.]